ncbi:MAG: hypothetical protein ACRERR_02465 [Moraxellaceae bacterium]
MLLTTFFEALANALRTKLKRHISSELRLAERLEIHAIGLLLFERNCGKAKLASREQIKETLKAASDSIRLSGLQRP